MQLKSYNNNNDRTPTSIVYSPIVFSNGESKISQSKLSISYFNKLMKISIALRNNANSNDQFATYNNDNAAIVYVSYTKAKILSNLIKMMKTDDSIHNVCIELKNGLFKVSDGEEYGSKNTCISILYATEDGSVHDVTYECKSGVHSGAYNYNDGKFDVKCFDDIELNTIEMVLDEYYKASSYAIASTVMEAGMYKRQGQYDLIKSIANTVGASTGKGNNGKFNNKTFLSNNNNDSNSLNTVPKEYESASFDDIASGI